ncbi:MAG: outer rane efflux protein, partial [Anaerospora sp.]|nr:outer rane efflux protein [Anaerospora sp.]
QTRNYSGAAHSPADSRASFIEAKAILYSGGLNEGLTAQAKELYTGAQHHLTYTRQQVITNTYLTYYTVLQAEKNVGLANEAVERLIQHLSIVEAQYAEGTVIKSDVLPAGQDITLADTGTVSAYEGPVAQAIQTALMQRADLKQVRQEAKAVQQGIQIAKSGQLPTVSLSLKKDWQNQVVPANPLSAQVALSFNVFDGRKTKAKIKQTEWETSQKHELLQQKTEQVMLETQEAYFNMQNARTDLDIASQVVAKAEEDYAIAQVRYQSGMGINLDVMDSQGALTTAKLNYSNARYDYNKYTIQLAQAMGTITEDESNNDKENKR